MLASGKRLARQCCGRRRDVSGETLKEDLRTLLHDAGLYGKKTARRATDPAREAAESALLNMRSGADRSRAYLSRNFHAAEDTLAEYPLRSVLIAGLFGVAVGVAICLTARAARHRNDDAEDDERAGLAADSPSRGALKPSVDTEGEYHSAPL